MAVVTLFTCDICGKQTTDGDQIMFMDIHPRYDDKAAFTCDVCQECYKWLMSVIKEDKARWREIPTLRS